MAFKPSGTPKMIVQYEWILENVEKEPEPKTIASKMILFRGEKVFRVGLKNHIEKPVLFLMAIDLNKIGMKVEEVMYGIQDSGISPAIMSQLKQEKIGDDGNLQLFTTKLDKQIVGKCTFVFRICIEGSVPGYSYQLSDRLAKDQLWAAATNKNGVDVEFVVKDKTFYAHKAILAARSPVFAAKFTKEVTEFCSLSALFNEQHSKKQRQEEKQSRGRGRPPHQIQKYVVVEPSRKFRSLEFAAEFTMEQPVVADGPHQILIFDVEPFTVEQFLHFIYTGESMGTLANEELLILADRYQLTTLSSLCRVALKKIEPMQMVSLANNLNKEAKMPSSNIRPDKDTEIFFDRTTPSFRCTLSFDISQNQPPLSVMQYQKENICFASVTAEKKYSAEFYIGNRKRLVNQPVIHCSCAKHRSFGLEVEDIYFFYSSGGNRTLYKMESKNSQKNAEMLHFTTQPKGFTFICSISTIYELNFDIKIVSTIDNYYYEMMDDAWIKDFWSAATNRKFTDVEIFVGTVKVMEVHRIILSARSPVLNESLSKITNTGKSIVTFGAEFNVEIVKLFLKFLYTGSLESSASDKQLLTLATLYDVKTLKNMCQLTNRAPPDVEDLTSSLLGL